MDEDEAFALGVYEGIRRTRMAVAAVVMDVWRESQADDMIIRDAGIMQDVADRFMTALQTSPGAKCVCGKTEEPSGMPHEPGYD